MLSVGPPRGSFAHGHRDQAAPGVPAEQLVMNMAVLSQHPPWSRQTRRQSLGVTTLCPDTRKGGGCPERLSLPWGDSPVPDDSRTASWCQAHSSGPLSTWRSSSGITGKERGAQQGLDRVSGAAGEWSGKRGSFLRPSPHRGCESLRDKMPNLHRPL